MRDLDKTREQLTEELMILRKRLEELRGAESVTIKSRERIEKLTECFLKFGPDPDENINHLVSLCGEALEATCALFNRLEGGMLCSIGTWKAPSGYVPKDKPDGHICYDVIKQEKDAPFIVRNLPDTKYAHTDPNVMKYGLKTYIGFPVKSGDLYIGSLCLVYQTDLVPTEDDIEFIKIVASAIGIEERRRKAREELKVSEENYRTLAEAARDFIFMIDRDLKVQYINHFAAEQFGARPSDLIGEPFDELFTHEVAEHQKKAIMSVLTTGKGISMEENFTLGNKTLWLNTLLAPIKGADDNVTAVLGISRDVTARREAEEKLKESELKFRTLTESAPIMITIIKGMSLVYTNSRFRQTLGYTEEEISRMTFPEMVHPDYRSMVVERAKKRIKGEEVPSHYEFRYLTKTGEERWVDFTSSLINISGEIVIMASGYDITERKIAEEAIAKREDQLEILSRTSVHINAVLEIPQILRTVVGAAMEVVGAEGGAAGLYENGKMIFTEYNKAGKINAFEHVVKEGEGVPGIVMKTMKMYMTNDALHDSHVSQERRSKLEFRNIINVPIMSRKGELLGCIEIYNKENNQPFDIQDMSMMQGLSASAAVALENAHTLIERRRAEAALQESIAERRLTEEQLSYRLEFEKLITKISTNFINMATEDIDDGLCKALKEIGEFAGMDRSNIFLISEDGKNASLTHEWCAKETYSEMKGTKPIPMENFPEFSRRIHKFETVYAPKVEDLPSIASSEKRWLTKRGVKATIHVPMVYGGSLVGILCFDSIKVEKEWAVENIALLKIAGEIFTNALERKWGREKLEALNEELTESNRKMRQLALKDSHTGLYNHQYLSEVIEAELYRAKRYASPLSIIMIDIDYFKSINDVYGHQFGDLVLKQFARQLQRLVRKYDVIARFGGEEFVIMTPGTDLTRAMLLSQRILDAINLYNFGNKEHSVKLKLSISVVSYPEDRAIKGVDLINLADNILNKVKERGGNRVYSSYDIYKEKKQAKPLAKESKSTRLLKNRIDQLTKKGNQSLMEAIFAFAKALELKDHYTGEHVENTVRYATDLARAMNLNKEDVEVIREAAILHDLGKIAISDKILHKRAKLSAKEFEEIKKHPQIGADIIRPIQFLHPIVPLIFYHHERWDGRGYPNGLKGDDIPVGARIIAVSDVYQALTSDRPYRKAFSKKKAIEIIKAGAGTQFDPKIVDTFLKILKKRKGR